MSTGGAGFVDADPELCDCEVPPDERSAADPLAHEPGCTYREKATVSGKRRQDMPRREIRPMVAGDLLPVLYPVPGTVRS